MTERIRRKRRRTVRKERIGGGGRKYRGRKRLNVKGDEAKGCVKDETLLSTPKLNTTIQIYMIF